MILASAFCLCLLGPGALPAQTSETPGVTALKHEYWVARRLRTWWEGDHLHRRPYYVHYYSAKIKNASTKKIASVVWDFVFVRLSDGRELARQRFATKKNIAIGKTATLEAASEKIPDFPRVVNVEEMPNEDNRFRTEVEIKCVLYDDDSIWRHPSIVSGECEVPRRDRKGKFVSG